MWTWILAGLVVWVLLAFVVAAVIGRGIRMADVASPGTGEQAAPVLPGAPRTSTVASRAARRRVPLPPVGIALAGVVVALETVGYVLRLNGATGRTA